MVTNYAYDDKVCSLSLVEYINDGFRTALSTLSVGNYLLQERKQVQSSTSSVNLILHGSSTLFRVSFFFFGNSTEEHGRYVGGVLEVNCVHCVFW